MKKIADFISDLWGRRWWAFFAPPLLIRRIYEPPPPIQSRTSLEKWDGTGDKDREESNLIYLARFFGTHTRFDQDSGPFSADNNNVGQTRPCAISHNYGPKWDSSGLPNASLQCMMPNWEKRVKCVCLQEVFLSIAGAHKMHNTSQIFYLMQPVGSPYMILFP